jgi:hypothetical protein
MDPFRFFRRKGMRGAPPSRRPPDPVQHAKAFCREYFPELDYHAAQTMLDLGIPPEKIGDSDMEHGIRHAALHPHGTSGGTVTPDGRIILDSGVMNLDLLPGKAGGIWARSGLRSRMQAIIAHELTEHLGGSHEAALRSAPDTELPVSDRARQVLRAMAR